MSKRLALIDGSNLYEAAKTVSLRLDYKKLLELLNEDGQLLRAYYFTALPVDRSVPDQIIKLTDYLSYNGYKVVSKDMKEFVDDKGVKVRKGNVDIDIAVYALTLITEEVEELWLFSGDGDFAVLVDAIQKKHLNIKVYVVSSMKIVSNDLRKQADRYIDLTELRNDIQQ